MYKTTYITTLTTIVIGFALPHLAVAGSIDWNLQNAGITNASEFTADALKATEVSHIVFTNMGTFIEHGFAQVTGVVDNGVTSTPTGLNTTYSLYFDFSITGDLMTSQFTTFSFDLYGVNGVTQFGINNVTNDAFINTGANPAILLATNSLVSGSVAGGAGTDLAAQSLSIFSATAAGAPAFLAPNLPAYFQGAYFHALSEPGGITPVGDGIVIHGGDDTLTFTPEPSSMLLVFAGIPGLLLLRRRR